MTGIVASKRFFRMRQRENFGQLPASGDLPGSGASLSQKILRTQEMVGRIVRISGHNQQPYLHELLFPFCCITNRKRLFFCKRKLSSALRLRNAASFQLRLRQALPCPNTRSEEHTSEL